MKSVPILFAVLVSCYLSLHPGLTRAEPKYVGNEGCGCHKSQITSWKRSAHAKAFESLRPGKRKTAKKRANLDPDKDYTKDKECLKCHVTGYQAEGGFQDAASTPKMTGVGCESCHGPGSKYRILHDEKATSFTREEAKADGAWYGSEDPDVCLACHNNDSQMTEKIDKKYKFEWKQALEKRKSYHTKITYDFSKFKY